MIKLRRRLGSAFLAVLMLLSLLPATAFAAGEGNEASIDGTEYATLQEALNAAQDGQTVKLLKDVEVTSDDPNAAENQNPALKITKAITLDGNNCTITAGEFKMFPGFLGNKAGNSILDVQGVNNEEHQVVIKNLTIVGNKTSKHGLNIFNSSNVVIDNVIVKNTAGTGLVANSSTVTVESMTASGNGWGSINADSKGSRDTSLTIKNGTFETGRDGSVKVEETGEKSKNTVVNITGGNFKGNVYKTYGSEAELSISGGTFTKDVSDYVEPGLKQDTDGNIVRDPNAQSPYMAQIGDTWYKTLQDAVKAAEDNDTVKVYPGNHDITPDNSTQYQGQTGWYLAIDKSITLQGVDESGKDITDPAVTKANIYSTTVNGNGSWPNQNLITVFGGDVTIKGLTIMNKVEPNKAIEVVGPATITVEDCKFAPIPEGLWPEGAAYSYEDYKDYGSGIYFNSSNKAEKSITATVRNNIFDRSGITFGGTASGEYTISGNTFTGVKKDKDGTYSSISYTGKWMNPEGTSLGTTKIEVENNTFENAGPINFSQVTDPTSKLPVFTDNKGLKQEQISGPVKVGKEIMVNSADALKVAIAQAKEGDTIVLAAGNYEIGQIDLANKKGITIQGAGMSNTTLVGKLNLTGDCSGLTIKDLTLKGGDGATVLMKVADNAVCTNMKVEKVAFVGGTHGIYLGNDNKSNNDANIQVKDCQFKDMTYAGIYAQRGDLKVTGSTFENINGNDATAAGILFDTGYFNSKEYSLTVTGNTFKNIKGTTSDDKATGGVSFTGTGTVKEFILTDNTFGGNTYDVRVGKNGGVPTISSSEMYNNGAITIHYPAGVAKEDATVTIKYGNGQKDKVENVLVNTEYELPAAPSRPGYTFTGWSDGTNLYEAGKSVTIKKDTTFTAQWSDNTPYYAITVEPADNGTVTCYAKSAAKGATVTVKVKPDVGYQLDKLVVTDAKGNVIEVKQESYGTYTFVMPGSKVTVEGVFVKTTPETLPFTDVKPTDWFYNSVKYVYDNGLMNGVENNQFAPNATLNRAMMVTILYRLDGQPAVSGDVSFTDVPAGTWYTNAVKWASDNGIVNGMEGNQFAPNGDLTREQMAAILYRYAEYKKLDVSASADLTAFVDGDKTSAWAEDAMKWAVGSELINGLEGNTLAPQGTSTRAQVATVLMRFCENIMK